MISRIAQNLASETISNAFQVANSVHSYKIRYASDCNFYLFNGPNITEGQRSLLFFSVGRKYGAES